MKSKIFLMLIPLSLFFIACEKDIELDLPDQNKLVIFSNFTPDSLFSLYLATTFPIDTSQNQNNIYPTNANIQLFENGIYVDDFISQPSIAPGFSAPNYTLNKRPDPNAEYSIIAKLPGYPDATAKNSIPSSIVIDDFALTNTVENKSQTFPGEKNYQLDAQLKVNVRNLSTGLLHLIVWKNSVEYFVFSPGDTMKYITPQIVDFDISNAVEHVEILHENGELIDLSNLAPGDDGFDIKIQFPFYSDFELKSPVYIEVRHVSEDYYLFHKTVGEQEASSFQESLLSTQSILVHSNIENGLGYFGGYSVAVDSIFF